MKCVVCELEFENPEGAKETVCPKCEQNNRTCAFCGKVHASSHSPDIAYYGVPYCNSCVADRRPIGFRENSGCNNCAHVFRREEYECGDRLFCLDNAPPRPPCGSACMGEIFGLGPNDKYVEKMHQWEMWSINRGVTPNSICDKWELEKKEPISGD